MDASLHGSWPTWQLAYIPPKKFRVIFRTLRWLALLDTPGKAPSGGEGRGAGWLAGQLAGLARLARLARPARPARPGRPARHSYYRDIESGS